MRAGAPGADDRHVVVALEPQDQHHLGPADVRDLARDGSEHVGRRCAPGDQAGDGAQRCVFAVWRNGVMSRHGPPPGGC
jgi:hypothetical protein